MNHQVDALGASDEALVQLLAEYLPAQRWFAAKGEQLSADSYRVVRRTVIARDFHDGDVEQVLLEVTTRTRQDIYQLWVAWTWHVPDRVAHAVIGTHDGHTAYDALADVNVTALLLTAVDEGRDFGGADGVRARREPDAVIDADAMGLVISAEQSNTSIVYGHSAILKVFRRLDPGPNPDAEVHRALHAVGSRHIAQPFGEIVGPLTDAAGRTGDPAGGTETTFALLTEFFANSADGWAMATGSVRDLMSEGDLRADEVGGDFAAESYRLGEAVAAMHAELVRAFGSSVVSGEALSAILSAMRTEAAAAADQVPSLAEHRTAIQAAFVRAGDHSASLNLQRIHGDLHLGQVLRTLDGWKIIDFEGEPAKPLGFRRGMHSPLKDVAGMLRSFDYAARGQTINPHPDAQHRYRATEWAARNRKSFCDGYAEAAGTDPRNADSLLRAFELDKAIYEVVYEHGHRPTWEAIPLQAVVALTNPGGSA
ncbi:MAG TPA: aminoglycoside phosphotransferase [Nakamurella sp.]